MNQITPAVPSAVRRRGASLVSRHARRACVSSIAMPIARGIIGRRTRKECKQRAAELRDEALFKDPPAKEECPICFLPIPIHLISCISLPPATISSVPIFDYADAHEELTNFSMEQYYECCGKRICRGCIESLFLSKMMNIVRIVKRRERAKQMKIKLKNC
jgi:hypothetical protein